MFVKACAILQLARSISVPFSSPEPTIILTCGRDRELWLCPTPEVRDSRTSRQIWQIWLAENMKRILYVCSEIRGRPELSIPAEGQNDRGLWGRECQRPRINIIAPRDQFQQMQISAEQRRWLLKTSRHYSRLYVTIRDYSPLFGTVRTIRYWLFATIRYSLLGFSRHPKTYWSKTKTHWSKTKIHRSKTKIHRSNT